MPVQYYKQVELYWNAKARTCLFIWILYKYWKRDYTKIDFGDNQEYYSY